VTGVSVFPCWDCLCFEPVHDWWVPLVGDTSGRLVTHFEHDRELVTAGVGEPDVKDPDHWRQVGVRADFVGWRAAQGMQVVAGDDDGVANVAVFDMASVTAERFDEAVHFAGDLKGVGVVDEAFELISKGCVEVDSDVPTLPELLTICNTYSSACQGGGVSLRLGP
jgi:hypothetical protein